MTQPYRESVEGSAGGADEPGDPPADGPESASPGGNGGSGSGLPDRTTLGDPEDRDGGRDQVVVLPPPKDDDPTWRRPRSLPWWVIVPAVLLAAFGLYEAGQRGWFGLGGQAVQARSEASQVRDASAERSAASRRFRRTADSLQTAIQGYQVRRSDFEQNRIDCASLASGYRRVDRHFVSLSVLLRERDDGLDAGARERYEELTGQVDEVNRHFDGTGCRTGG